MGWPTTIRAQIAFDSDPNDTPIWEDVSGYVYSFSLRRGRQHELDRVEAGTAMVTLDNQDRRFDPSNADGPYYPNVVPMRRLQLAAAYREEAVNYVENPSFEVDTTGWSAINLTIARTGDDAYVGGYSLRLSGTGDNQFGGRYTLDPGSWAVGNTLAITVHSQYVAGAVWSAYLRDQASNIIGGAQALPTAAGWHKTTWTYTIAAGVTEISLNFRIPNGSPYSELLIDAIQIEISDSPSDYVDGDQGHGYSWDGTAHGSISRYEAIPIFTGYIESWPQRWRGGPNDALVEVQAVDAFKAFNLRKIYIAVPEELSGARVTRVLDHIGWPAGDREIDAGQSLVQAETMDEAVLYQLQTVADAENGLLFVDGAGRVVFRNRHARVLAATEDAPEFGDSDTPGELPYHDLTLSYDDAQLWNHVIVQRANSSNSAVVEDTDSQDRYFKRTLERRDVIITTDAECEAAAGYLLGRYKDPSLRIEKITILPGFDDALWPVVLGTELGDRVIVRRTPPGGGDAIEQPSFVEGISHDVTPRNWRTSWRLTAADRETFWILAGADDDEYAPFSRLEQTTRLAY